jgi:hypothetical protein
LNKEFKQPRRFERRLERRRERERLRGLRYARHKRWLKRFLLTVWYVLLVFATVSTIYHLRVGF